jgi:hypothetical protein
MGYQTQFLTALALDVAVETVVGILVLNKLFSSSQLKLPRITYGIVLANCSSLPYLWLVLPAFIKNYTVYVIAGETLVFAWEAFLYRMFFLVPLKHAMLLSLLANSASFVVGLLLL